MIDDGSFHKTTEHIDFSSPYEKADSGIQSYYNIQQ